MVKYFDVIIIGAGIAGSACARFLAAGGRRVALVDRRPFEKAGARWVNGVPIDAFHATGLPLPAGPELRGADQPFVLASPSGRGHVRLEQSRVREVDMRLLGSRLRADALAAGATGLERTAIRQVHLEAGRVASVSTPESELHAPLVIDASGMPAVARRAAFPDWPEVPLEHLCLAAQAVHRIADLQGARVWLNRNRLAEGETLAVTGLAGGYSVLNIRVDLAQEEVSLLSGSIPDHTDRPTGRELLERFLTREPWIGPAVFGGANAIPVRRPYARLVAPGLALLGDAACQVFSAHGSGIAIGLRAARLLADVILASPPGRAGEEQLLWGYAASFHRTLGGLLAAYNLLRRLTQRLSLQESEALITSRLASPALLLAAMHQQLPPVSVRELASTLTSAIRVPRLALRLAGTSSRIPACLAAARTYPLQPDLDQLARFEARMARIFHEHPDPVG